MTFSVLVRGYGECEPVQWSAISGLLSLMERKYSRPPSISASPQVLVALLAMRHFPGRGPTCAKGCAKRRAWQYQKGVVSIHLQACGDLTGGPLCSNQYDTIYLTKHCHALSTAPAAQRCTIRCWRSARARATWRAARRWSAAWRVLACSPTRTLPRCAATTHHAPPRHLRVQREVVFFDQTWRAVLDPIA